jgi:hypothetical protein
LKFLDEAHIMAKDLLNRKILGLRNHRVYMKANTLHSARASITILISITDIFLQNFLISGCSIYIDYREDTNDQYNFLEFVLSAIAQNMFEVGDYLIINNTTVHYGTDTFDIVTNALDSVGTKLIFLLAYSPELNPCELCFSVIKQYIRKRLTSNDIPIWAKVLLATAKITTIMLEHFYQHCIYPPNILPEFR